MHCWLGSARIFVARLLGQPAESSVLFAALSGKIVLALLKIGKCLVWCNIGLSTCYNSTAGLCICACFVTVKPCGSHAGVGTYFPDNPGQYVESFPASVDVTGVVDVMGKHASVPLIHRTPYPGNGHISMGICLHLSIASCAV